MTKKSNKIDTKTLWDFAKVDCEKENEVHLMVKLTAPKLSEDSERQPVNICAVVDVSGSMSGQKLDYAKKSLVQLVKHLGPSDRLSLTSFGSYVRDEFEPILMGSDNKEKAISIINDLRVTGCTNLSGGYLQAINHAKVMADKKAKDCKPRLLVFTDGLPNEGISDYAGLINVVESNLKHADTSTFGYGSDHDPELLVGMANVGKGNFYFVKNPDDAPKAFGRELGGLISTFAQNVKLKIDAAEGVELLEVLNELDVTEHEERKSCTINVDDLFAEEHVNLLIKAKLPKKSKAVGGRASRVADLVVTYYDVEGKENEKIESKAKIEYVRSGQAQTEINTEVEEQILRFDAAKAQVEAQEKADAGDFVTARSIMDGAVCAIKNSHAYKAGSTFAQQLVEPLTDLIDNGLADTLSYNMVGNASMRGINNSYGRGKSARSSYKSTDAMFNSETIGCTIDSFEAGVADDNDDTSVIDDTNATDGTSAHYDPNNPNIKWHYPHTSHDPNIIINPISPIAPDPNITPHMPNPSVTPMSPTQKDSKGTPLKPKGLSKRRRD